MGEGRKRLGARIVFSKNGSSPSLFEYAPLSISDDGAFFLSKGPIQKTAGGY
jgi:hypothetical protein